MSYMTCPRCGLSIRLRAPYLTLEGCPRCLARRRVSIQMDISEQPRDPVVEQERGGGDGHNEQGRRDDDAHNARRENVSPEKAAELRVTLKRGADKDV